MKNKALEVNPTIDALSKAPARESLVKFEGYIGPSPPNVVRLYFDLSMDRYLEVARDDVIHAEQLPGSKDGRVRLWLSGSAKLEVVQITHMTASECGRPKDQPADSAPGVMLLPAGGHQRCIDLLNQITAAGNAAQWAANQGNPEFAQQICAARRTLIGEFNKLGCGQEIGMYPQHSPICDRGHFR